MIRQETAAVRLRRERIQMMMRKYRAAEVCLALLLALCMLSGCHGTLTTKASIGTGDTEVPAQFDETKPI